MGLGIQYADQGRRISFSRDLSFSLNSVAGEVCIFPVALVPAETSKGGVPFGWTPFAES